MQLPTMKLPTVRLPTMWLPTMRLPTVLLPTVRLPTMRLPTIRGTIARRLLINFSADPAVVAALLPPPFRPHLVAGRAVIGLCLIRLAHARPSFLPRWIGLGFENAAQRIAVDWNEGDEVRTGVYVLRRDTESCLAFTLAQHGADFHVRESPDGIAVSMWSDDGTVTLDLRTSRSAQFPASSVFGDLDTASAFFRQGNAGYSPTADPTRHQGIALHCDAWRVEPVAVHAFKWSWLDDPKRFPTGAVRFDCALIMRDVEHEWRPLPDVRCAAS